MVTSFPEKHSSTKWLNGPACRRMLPRRLPKAWPLQNPSLLTEMSITCWMVICANAGMGCFSWGYLKRLFSFLVHSWWLILQLSDYLTTELPKLPDLSLCVLRLFSDSARCGSLQPSASGQCGVCFYQSFPRTKPLLLSWDLFLGAVQHLQQLKEMVINNAH